MLTQTCTPRKFADIMEFGVDVCSPSNVKFNTRIKRELLVSFILRVFELPFEQNANIKETNL